MEVNPLIVYDRSRVTTDWRCPRLRFLQYDLEGKGIVPSHQHLELFLGTQIHDGLSAIAHGVDIDAICQAAVDQVMESLLDATNGEVNGEIFAHEQSSLVEGLLRGFYKHTWPRLMETYPKILFIEEEMKYEHNGLVFMSRPDLVLEGPDGPVYIEYKSTGSKKEEWINSWETAIQLHSTVKAIEHTKGIKCVGAIVQGLYKGWVAYGKQTSPMCYAYLRKGNPPFTKDEVSYEYKAGLKKYPTWELEGGVKRWVEEMPDTVLQDQFPQTPMIFIKDDMVERFFNQRDIREHEIKLAKQILEAHKEDKEASTGLLDAAFPQRFDQCTPSFGKPCQMKRICHGGVENPLENGFEFRVPHHELEIEIWKEREVINEENPNTPPA